MLSNVVETLAVAALVALNILALVSGTGSFGNRARLAATASLIVWLYTLALVCLRLFLGNSKWRVPRLWNHTATIYGVTWVCSLVIFRSAIINPSSDLAEAIVITEFALITLLWGMAVTTRKGNKTVMMEWENGLEPSREPLASLFSICTFSWVDGIVWAGWTAPLEMDTVWNLLPKDKAANVIAHYRTFKQTGSLAVHLLSYFKGMLIGQCLLAALAGIFTFAPTMLLKYILEYVEQPDSAPRNVIWLFVILLPVLDTIRSIADNISLWTGRKICIRMRSIVIGDIYAKALRRKAAAGKDKVLLADDDQDPAAKGAVNTIKRAFGFKGKKKQSAADAAADALPALAGDEQANLGTIINLMSVDSFKISETTAYLHFLVGAAPVQLALSVFLLWQVMGLSAIPGIIVMIFLVPVNYLLANGFSVTSKNIMAATDQRIHVTNEVLQNIRIIKYFAWEKRFGTIIDEKRENELQAMRSRYILWSVAVAIWNSVPVLITFFSFVVYTLVEKRPLYPSVAFTAISLFMLLRIPLDMLGDMFAHVQEAKVSVERVEEFLKEGETEKYEQLGTDNVDEDGVKHIGFRDTTLSWSSKDNETEPGTGAFRLWDLNIDFLIGKLNLIAGPTGSGKTSLLMGLLGEMSLYSGKVFCPGGRSRDDVRPDPETGLADTIAYVAQAAWLLNGSIKTNILFGAPFNEKRYNDVIVACALERDLDILDHGDETLVGEKGITLSGGQKQRISLARAVYSDSEHILMDDCLSAVDSHTAHWIFHRCLKGPLMENRTCILVTHNVQLCAPLSDYIVMLDNGRVSAQGPSDEVIAAGKLGEDLAKSRPASALPSCAPSRASSSLGDTTVVDGNGDAPYKPKVKKKVAPQVDPMDEGKATGAVKWPVVRLYITSMGSWWFWAIALIVFQLQQLAPVATNIWVRTWANQYVHDEVQGVVYTSATASYNNQFHPKAAWATIAKLSNIQVDQSPAFTVAGQTPIGIEPNKEVNAVYYVFGLAFIGALGAFTAFVRDIWIFFGSLTASRRLHNHLLGSVMRARFKFFDVTPLGQIVNRFSKDLEAVDQDIAPTAIGVLACALSLIVTVVLIAAITPGFLIAAVFIAVLFYGIAIFYLRASRDLKRLESVQRSPLFQQFGETLSGMTTIRAYGVERRFIRENLDKVNTSNRPFIYLWALNRWLAFRADFIGNSVSFFAGVFIILSIGKIDAGSAGISLSYAMSFTDNVLWLVRQYGTNEQNMNSMERIKEYLDVEQEAAPIIEDNRPAETWPEKGSVEFVNYSTRYRADLEPVLRSISLKINAKEKVGIVGRTGAGKSSLTLALFRALEADKGEILVDGVNIGAIGLQDLREKITIVPQDPTLFSGTLRSNLDPFDQYTDGQVFEALRRVHLIGDDDTSVPATPVSALASNKNIFLDLATPVAESGSNLSQGQRQLLCLARAMLKKPKVLVMDEATASIDYNTDSKIQETIREMRGTVITIAHRLQTIVDYDKVLVLDKGEKIEYAHPWELISDERTQFYSMCESSGDLDILKKAAKKKWDEGHLVDVAA